MSKCFCHFGEFEVKDAQARRDIETANKKITNEVSTLNELINNQLSTISTGTPLIANSISEMVDTTRIYVNTTDGHWYYYNGVEWMDGGVYQSIENSTLSINLDKLKYNEVKSIEIWDKNNVIEGGYISSDNGQVQNGVSGELKLDCYSDYIKIKPDTRFYCKGIGVYTLYNENKEYITSIRIANSESKSVLFNENSHYIRISCRKDDINNVSVTKGKFPTADKRVMYDMNIYHEENDEIMKFNMFDKNKIMTGYILHWNDELEATTLEDNSLYFTSDYIKLPFKGIYSIRIKNNYNVLNNLNVHTYGTNYAHNQHYENNEIPSIVIDLQNNPKYIRVSGLLSDLDNIIVEYIGERKIFNDNTLNYKDIDNTKIKIPNLIVDQRNDGFIENNGDGYHSYKFHLKDNYISEYFIKTAKLAGKNGVTIEEDEFGKYVLITATEDPIYSEGVPMTFKYESGKAIKLNFKATGKGRIAIRYRDKNNQNVYSINYSFDSGNYNFKEFKYTIPTPKDINFLYIKIDNNYSTSGEIKIKDFNMYQTDLKPTGKLTPIEFCSHLGEILLAPRNTIPAYQLAIDSGYNSMIINTNLTSDKVIVCLHDNTIDATSDGTGNIHNMTYEEASQYDYGSWFNVRYTGTKLPKLEDVLKLCATSGMHPVIRLGDDFNSGENITLMYNLLKKYGFNQHNASLKGFSLSGLQNWFNAYGNEFRYIHCVSSAVSESVINTIKSFGNDSIIEYETSVCTEENVQTLLNNGVKAGVWIVNINNCNLKQYIDYGVTYFTSDGMPFNNDMPV